MLRRMLNSGRTSKSHMSPRVLETNKKYPESITSPTVHTIDLSVSVLTPLGERITNSPSYPPTHPSPRPHSPTILPVSHGLFTIKTNEKQKTTRGYANYFKKENCMYE